MPLTHLQEARPTPPGERVVFGQDQSHELSHLPVTPMRS